MYTASFAFFEALWEAGVSHCFVNLGSDHPSILEAMVKGQRETPDSFPKIITCPNEMVALSAAHGMALTTGKPQAVVVHVDVGTQGLAAAVHNASMGRAPVLIFAGLSPFTQEGEMRGSRTEFIHWTQDVHNQREIVAQYCRYTAEIKTGRNIKQMVNRALSFATSDPKGPVYLVGAREVMEEDIEPYVLDQSYWTPIEPAALSQDGVRTICDALLAAKDPLVIVGYSGRKEESVGELVKLVDSVGARVLDSLGSDLCFPADHRSYLGVRYGVHDKITEADVLLLLDVDIPYIPTRCKPNEKALIYHIDVDPLKQQMPVFYVNAKARYRADATTALRQLNEYIASKGSTVNSARISELDGELKAREEQLAKDEQPLKDGTLSANYLMGSIRDAVPKDSVFMVEAVTMTAIVFDHLKLSAPGSIYNSGGGGLGWFGGASVGAKLGLMHTGQSKFVTAIVGDGTFLFGVPSSVYWMSRRYSVPFLTIVLNNSGWNAPRKSAQLVHPAGYTASATNGELNISFDPSPDYAGIAVASAGGQIWGGTVKSVEELGPKLKEAVAAVEGGRSAVLDCYIVGSAF
ncbi:thiamine pyrophosphate enzyme, N-terminal TPP binding domain-containing protein [Tricharina praecox]|uniref:thiamine pyrophosphate enzyme, N-terminal TPP binding domain-containing protein n=1 Tax=Tricharina praecox TaxID=43433 RepID=UPI00221E836E|nr:thiamine pyrophosphate enzyme, N-terminal TPP binding domain-containing protein [Tricharina praecox]KAI5851035.1 thiamine pyrophosphate enzyme, N-terminal TPP binding domain-containing protein [Tricharina praecox]